MARETYEFLVEGCGLRFGKDVTGPFKAKTRAVSDKKAIQNVLYHKKEDMGLNPNTKMDFEGKVTRLD